LMPASVFELISSVSTISFVLVWIILIYCHLKYRQQNPTGSAIFKMPGYPVTDYLTLFFFAGFLVFLLFDPTTRLPLLAALLACFCLFISYPLIFKNHRAE